MDWKVGCRLKRGRNRSELCGAAHERKGDRVQASMEGRSSWKKDEAMAVARREEATANRKHVDTMKEEKLTN